MLIMRQQRSSSHRLIQCSLMDVADRHKVHAVPKHERLNILANGFRNINAEGEAAIVRRRLRIRHRGLCLIGVECCGVHC